MNFFIFWFVSLSYLNLTHRLITWAMYPFLYLYTESPALIFLSSSHSSKIKFSKISSFSTELFSGEPYASVRAISIILITSLWRTLFMSYCLTRLRRIGKNLGLFAINSFEFKTFSFMTNLRIYMIFIRPYPSVGLLLLSTYSF